MTLKIVTGPTENLLSTAEAKAFLRVDSSSEDTLIDSLVLAATSVAEKFTNRVFLTQTWDLWLDRFPSRTKRGSDGWFEGEREAPLSSVVEGLRYIEIPKPPLQSITFLKTYNTSDTESEFSSSSYYVDTNSSPGRLALNYSESWPSVTLRPANGIQVRFVAGYGLAATVPEPIKLAVKMILTNLYENRGCDSVSMLPPNAFALLQPYQLMRF